MAGRGQIPNAELRRYDAVEVAPAVYLIQAGDMVKVGRGRSAHSRLRELHSSLARSGMAPGRFEVFYTDDYMDAEYRCIKALAKVATNPLGTREYFTGITFDAALEIVRAALSA